MATMRAPYTVVRQLLLFIAMLAPQSLGVAMTVGKIAYHGWPNAYRISNGTVQLIVLTDVGPRIIFYGFANGENEFHEFADQAGKTGGNEFRSYGGHRLWVSPETETTYFPDNVPVRVIRQADTVRFIAPVEESPKPTYFQKEIDVRVSPTGTHITVIHKITNHATDAIEMAPWALSAMAQNGRSIFPLPAKAPWGKTHLLPEGLLALWSYTDLSDRRWVFGTKYLQLRQDPNPTGQFKEQMIGLYDSQGWGAYFRKGHLFVKRAEVERAATYPDYGCNFETYTEPGFLELESLGPLRKLHAGEMAVHVEDWWLFEGVPAGEGDDWVEEAIVPRVKQTQHDRANPIR
jgi:hypothetical protein